MARAKVILLGAEPASLVNFRGTLIKQLVAGRYDVHVAALAATPEQRATLAAMGVTYHAVPFARAGMNPLLDFKSFVALVNLFRKEQPDALIAYTSKPVIYGMLASWCTGVKNRTAMITGLGYSFIPGAELKRRVANLVSKTLYRLALSRATGVIFQNPDDRDEFSKLNLLPKHLMPSVVNGSGVNTQEFSQAPLPVAPIFLMMARLLVDKGVREYAAAAARVCKAVPGARCQLLGAMDPSPNAIAPPEIVSWQAAGFEYLGETQDVRPFISAASAVVLPSYREGTPRSVLEGMAMGRAIISTDAPGCRETVVHGTNGFLVPIRNVDALADAMVTLAQDVALRARMGEESRRMAVAKYDAVAVARDTILKAGLLPAMEMN